MSRLKKKKCWKMLHTFFSKTMNKILVLFSIAHLYEQNCEGRKMTDIIFRWKKKKDKYTLMASCIQRRGMQDSRQQLCTASCSMYNTTSSVFKYTKHFCCTHKSSVFLENTCISHTFNYLRVQQNHLQLRQVL